MAGTERIRVVCSSCDWAGRRLTAGEPCPKCGKPTIEPPARAPRSEDGRRVRVVVHVLPDTHDTLEREREQQDAVGVGTIGSQVLDAWAQGKRIKPPSRGG